ncbi:MAG: alpha/beta fold hydrolase [Sphingomonadales bacterium]
MTMSTNAARARRLLAIAALGWVVLGVGAFSQPANSATIPVEAFAQLPQVSAPAFSPDGKYLAMIRSINGRRHVVIQPSNGQGKTAAIPPVDKLEIDWFAWANNDRLIVSIKFEGVRQAVPTVETRLIAVNKDGSGMAYIVKPKVKKRANSRLSGQEIYAQIQDDIIDFLWNDPNHILLSLDSDRDGEYEVRKIDINTGDYRELGLDYRGIQNWTTDQAGELRFGSGYNRSSTEMLYRNPVTGKWEDFTQSTASQNGMSVISFAANPAHAYMWKINESGVYAIVKYDLINNEELKSIFSDPNYSAGHLMHDPLTRRPIGVYYIDDRPHVVYFDEKRRKRQRVLDKAIPGTYNRVVSSTEDDSLHIVLSTSDTEPGMYYAFDEAGKKLHPMALRYNGLDPKQLAPMKAVTYKARDGLDIPAYLTLPTGKEARNLPLVIMPHGGPHSRDYIDFDYWTQFLASRGYAVLQPNFRGSDGYTTAFEEAGRKNWGLEMQDDLTDGVNWLIAEGVADKNRVCIVGASYGGYAALMGAVKTPDLYRCAASINGVADMPGLIKHDKRYIGGSAWAKTIGDSHEDAQRHRDTSPYYHVDKIKAPILLIHAKDDRRVPYHQSRAMARKLKKARKKHEYVELKGGGHGLDTKEARLTMLKALEKFLARHLGRAS